MAFKLRSPLHKSPLNIGAKYTFKNLEGTRAPRFSVSKYMEAAPGTKFAAATSRKDSSFDLPSKITSKTGGSSNLDFSKGDIIGHYGKGKSKTSNDSDGIMVKDADKNNAARIKNKTSVKPKSSTSTKAKPAAKPISSSDSGDRSGGYLKDTKNFSLGVDTSMGGNISKVQNVVSKARDAGHNLISGGAMSKRDRIRNRQGIRTENKRKRVGQQIERIKGRQQRAGISKDKGTNPGYSTEQKKLDAFEKSMGTPKASNTTGQKAAKGSIKLKPTMSKTQTLTDSQLNKKLNKTAVKKKTTGKTKSLSMTRGEKQTSLTDLAMTGKK